MDIHRCRFVQYPADPIHALAFSHPSNTKEKSSSDLRLALGRGNGDIEIFNPQNGRWVQEVIFKGSKDSVIEQLAWTQDLVVEDEADALKYSRGPLRLFSSSGSNSITEWDIGTGSPRKQTEGNFGDIWCFAVQPQIESPEKIKGLEGSTHSQLIAAGCANGTIILFSTEDDDLRYLRPLLTPPVKKPRVVSITWRDRHTVVAGYEDSTIRVIDVRTRTVIRHMSLGKPVDGEHTVVWAVKCLPDGTILSGDSTGELKIWDAKNFSLVQRLKSHTHDIVDLATNVDGNVIFSFGVDRRTVSYRPAVSPAGGKKTRWAEISHQRYHRHDVKCAATFESKDLSVLISGGMDCKPVVVPIRKLQTESHRKLSPLPQRPLISASASARLFISWWNHEIVVYRVRAQGSLSENVDFDDAPGSSYEILARMIVQGDENIQDAQLSADGQFIIAATIKSVRLFQLRQTFAGGRPCVRTRPIDLPPALVRLGAKRVGFSPDGKWVFTIRKDNTVALNKLVPSDDSTGKPTIHTKTVKLYRATRGPVHSALGGYPQTINHVAISGDSRVLGVSDVSGAIDTWVLEGHEDLDYIEDDKSEHSSDTSSNSSDDEDEDDSPVIHAQKWIRNPSGSQLPKLDSSILALTFRPSPRSSLSVSTDGNRGLHATRHTAHPVAHELPTSNEMLIAVTAKHQLVEFDVLSCRLSDWSRRNPSRFLPQAFKSLNPPVTGCFWDCTDRVNKGERLWLYGSNWLFMLDVSQDLPQDKGPGKAEKIGTLGRYNVLDPVSPHPHPDGKRRQGGMLEMFGNGGNAQKKRKRNTGAGRSLSVQQRASGIGRAMLKYTGPTTEGDNVHVIDMDVGLNPDGDDDMDMDIDGDDDALALMRREREADEQLTGRGGNGDGDGDAKTMQKPRRLHWKTYEYSDILGVGVIGPVSSTPEADSDSANGVSRNGVNGNGNENEKGLVEKTTGQAQDQDHNLEIVIVERDVYDMIRKSPYGRIDTGQDWDT
ncbi:U3 small nucleolar RNA-associated protein [Rhinocladiella similis]